MPTPNPQYNPRWKKQHDYHAQQRDDLCEQRRILQEHLLQEQLSESKDSKTRKSFADWQAIEQEIEQLDKKINEHFGEISSCLAVYQHETIQDAARWYFESLTHIDRDTLEAHLGRPIDYEQFQTIEQVAQTYNTLHEKQEMALSQRYNPPRIGSPNGSDIFEIGENSDLHTATYRFEPYEHVNKYSPSSVRILINKKDKDYHICFFENADKERITGSVTNYIEGLATALYWRLNAQNAHLPLEQERGSLQSLLTGLAKIAKGIFSPHVSPKNIHFYIYYPPPLANCGTNFERVDMDFQLGAFKNADFHPYDVVPAEVHKQYEAYRRTMPNIENSPEEPHEISDPPYHPLDKERRYWSLTTTWNSGERKYCRTISDAFQDFLALQTPMHAHRDNERRKFSFMRDIVSEFENYALSTAAEYVSLWGMRDASEQFKKRISAHKDTGESYAEACRYAVREHFSRMKCGKPRIQKILDLYRDIGYPVSEFERLERYNLENWEQYLDTHSKSYHEYMMHNRRGDRDPSALINYIQSIDELIFIRNEIEHGGGVYSSKKIDSTRPYAQKGHFVNVEEIDMVRYVNATLLFMNHLKRAFDYSLTDWDVGNTHRADMAVTKELIRYLYQDVTSLKERGYRFDPVLASGIFYSSTLDEREILNGTQSHFRRESDPIKETHRLMQQWISQNQGDMRPSGIPYTPYLISREVGPVNEHPSSSCG